MSKGILYGIAAYVFWGVFPLYWKQVHAVGAVEIIGHRIAWSFIMLALFLALTGQWRGFQRAALNWPTIGTYAIAAVLLSINWLIYVWGVNSDFIVETSEEQTDGEIQEAQDHHCEEDEPPLLHLGSDLFSKEMVGAHHPML